jgi:hypothetical protein
VRFSRLRAPRSAVRRRGASARRCVDVRVGPRTHELGLPTFVDLRERATARMPRALPHPRRRAARGATAAADRRDLARSSLIAARSGSPSVSYSRALAAAGVTPGQPVDRVVHCRKAVGRVCRRPAVAGAARRPFEAQTSTASRRERLRARRLASLPASRRAPPLDRPRPRRRELPSHGRRRARSGGPCRRNGSGGRASGSRAPPSFPPP